MGFQNLYPNDWIGKMVWVFQSEWHNDSSNNYATCAIVVDVGEARGSYIVLDSTGVTTTVWDMDLELMEDWDEEVEREDCSSEEP